MMTCDVQDSQEKRIDARSTTNRLPYSINQQLTYLGLGGGGLLLEEGSHLDRGPGDLGRDRGGHEAGGRELSGNHRECTLICI